MPELPEAERARRALETVVGRRITGVDDRDSYVCRPHPPGAIADALIGHMPASAHRRGKFLWLETAAGPTLGLHLGIAGHIVVGDSGDAGRWDRFALVFDDGTRLALRDKRRLGRAVLNPDFGHVGPDAALVGRSDFRRRVGVGRAPVKARLLDSAARAAARARATRSHRPSSAAEPPIGARPVSADLRPAAIRRGRSHTRGSLPGPGRREEQQHPSRH